MPERIAVSNGNMALEQNTHDNKFAGIVGCFNRCEEI